LLQQAITDASISPDDVVYLLAGTYFPTTTFFDDTHNIQGWMPTIAGTSGHPIVFASYPGQWAAIDRLWYLAGTSPVTTAYLCFSNMEFYDSLKGHNLTNTYYPTGPWVHFPMSLHAGFEWINCNIHDVDNCFGNGVGCTVRGCTFWYVGWLDVEHVCYPSLANFTGNISAWHIQNVINGAGGNALIESNIMFGGGQTAAANPSANSDIAGIGFNMTIDHNLVYNRHPLASTMNAVGLGFGSPLAGTVTIFDNIWAAPVPVDQTYGSGTTPTVSLMNNTNYACSTNYPSGVMIWNTLAGASCDYNSYYAVPSGGAGSLPVFTYNGTYNNSFASWKSTFSGFDVHSTIGTAGQLPPDSIEVLPNADVPKRANIAIYNWSRQSSVAVSMTGVLNTGDTYYLFYAGNVNQGGISGAMAVQSGTYNGTSISIAMTGLTNAPILYGTNTSADGVTIATPPILLPEFGAFILVGTAGGSTPNPLYFSENGAGAMTGADPADAQTITWQNTTGNIPNNWTVSVVGQITEMNVQANGETLLIPAGSGISSANSDGIAVYSGVTGLTIDGTGGGYIANSANGSALANQSAIWGIYCIGGVSGLTVKNLAITNIYVHTSLTDNTLGTDVSGGIYANAMSGVNRFSGILFSNCQDGILCDGTGSWTISNCTNQWCNHGVFQGSTAGSSVLFTNDLFGTCSNWDTTANTYHADGIIWYGAGNMASLITEACMFNGDMGVHNTAYFFDDGGAATIHTFANNTFIVHAGNTLNNGCMTGGGLLANNTFIDNGPAQTCLTIGGGSIGMNNLFVGFGTFVDYVTAISGLFSNNIYANPQPWGNFPWNVNGTTYSVFATYTNASGDGGSQYFSGINATTLVNTNTGVLPIGSAAAGMGNTNTYGYGVVTDATGAARLPNGPTDVGAFNAPAAPPTTVPITIKGTGTITSSTLVIKAGSTYILTIKGQ
jgi:hypothetical protein